MSHTPIPIVDSKNTTLFNRIVQLVAQMLELYKQFASKNIGYEKTSTNRQITATDAEIDRLVYQLYGLTDEEIRLVEEATS